MSGSYDRPGPPLMAPGPPGSRSEFRHDPRYEPDYGGDEPVTGPPGRSAPRLGPAEPVSREDLHAPTRSRRSEREQARSAIVPAGSITGRSLTLVITIMCFLACLTAGAVYMMNQSASAWLRDIASEVTVQVEARGKRNVETVLRELQTFLQQQPGVRGVKILKAEESANLLEPWLGQSDALKTLPVPRLMALEVDRQVAPDFVQLKAALAARFEGVSLDDHRQWQQQIRMVTRSFALGGLAILFLVACATTAVIVSATRSALASNREIVEVLHFVGATDRFIAREFERQFLRLGIRAGLVGAISAMLVFFLMPSVMEVIGGGGAALFELQRFIGTGALDLAGYGLLVLVVVVISALCMLTSRFWVYRTLHQQQGRATPESISKFRTWSLPLTTARVVGDIATSLRKTGRDRTLIMVRAIEPRVIVAGGAGVLLALLMLGFVVFANRVTAQVGAATERADAIVVLTGEASRIEAGVRLLTERKGKRLLISGVNRHIGREELLKLTRLPPHAFDCCVDIGYEAQDTRGNADEARNWVADHRFKSLLVVTASYHMPRSLAELALQLPGTRLIPYPIVPKRLKAEPWWLRLASTRLLAAEYLKLLPSVAKYALGRVMRSTDQPAILSTASAHRT